MEFKTLNESTRTESDISLDYTWVADVVEFVVFCVWRASFDLPAFLARLSTHLW